MKKKILYLTLILISAAHNLHAKHKADSIAVKSLEEKIQYRFKNQRLIERALDESDTSEKRNKLIKNGEILLAQTIKDFLKGLYPADNNNDDYYYTKLEAYKNAICKDTSLFALACQLGLSNDTSSKLIEWPWQKKSKKRNDSNIIRALIGALWQDEKKNPTAYQLFIRTFCISMLNLPTSELHSRPSIKLLTSSNTENKKAKKERP